MAKQTAAETITKFDRSNLDTVGNALEAAVQSVAIKYGLEIKSRGCTYSDRETTFRLRATVIGGAADNYLEHASRYGLPADGLGRKFVSNGHVYTITGLKPYVKFPVLSTREDGKSYGHRADHVVSLLKAAVAA